MRLRLCLLRSDQEHHEDAGPRRPQKVPEPGADRHAPVVFVIVAVGPRPDGHKDQKRQRQREVQAVHGDKHDHEGRHTGLGLGRVLTPQQRREPVSLHADKQRPGGQRPQQRASEGPLPLDPHLLHGPMQQQAPAEQQPRADPKRLRKVQSPMRMRGADPNEQIGQSERKGEHGSRRQDEPHRNDAGSG